MNVEIIMEFIRRFYVISYSNFANASTKILIKDMFESPSDNIKILQITNNKNVDVELLWGKIKRVTGVDLQHKDFYVLHSLLLKIFRNKSSLDFYDFLINEKENITIPLNLLEKDFPLLFGEENKKLIEKIKDNKQ
jgi:hypothetical protein